MIPSSFTESCRCYIEPTIGMKPKVAVAPPGWGHRTASNWLMSRKWLGARAGTGTIVAAGRPAGDVAGDDRPVQVNGC